MSQGHAMDSHPLQGGGEGVEIFLVASFCRNRDKLRRDGPLGSYADFLKPCSKGKCLVHTTNGSIVESRKY